MHHIIIAFGRGEVERDRKVQLTPGKHVLDLFCDTGDNVVVLLLL